MLLLDQAQALVLCREFVGDSPGLARCSRTHPELLNVTLVNFKGRTVACKEEIPCGQGYIGVASSKVWRCAKQTDK
jgi:hypothetical protein